MNYLEYIQSAEWAAKSEYIRTSRGNKCQVCGISGLMKILHAHHNTYLRLGREIDTDLVVLCEDCHALYHANGLNPGRMIELKPNKIKSILWEHGVTYTSDDPWRYYGIGKRVLWELAGGDWKLFDKYNRVNIEMVDIACGNKERRDERIQDSSFQL